VSALAFRDGITRLAGHPQKLTRSRDHRLFRPVVSIIARGKAVQEIRNKETFVGNTVKNTDGTPVKEVTDTE
jgi:hypothetical protein